jgi:trans-aconitate 2-methyltransferase
MQWNPAQYLKFGAARIRPAIDLLQKSASLIANPNDVKRVLDLGCGPGNVVPFLAQAYPTAHICGVDSSKEMIDKAIKSTAGSDFASRTSYRVGTIEEEVQNLSTKYDLLYTNAALHWCTNHAVLFPKMLKNLVTPKGGVLAIQMPDTKTQNSHVLMETAAYNCGFHEEIKDIRIPRAELDADQYYSVMAPHVTDLEIWSTEYAQALTPSNKFDTEQNYEIHPVYEFTKSTGLMPILQALGGESHPKCKRFLQEYNRLLTLAYPYVNVKGTKLHEDTDRVVLMPFRRLFLICKH